MIPSGDLLHRYNIRAIFLMTIERPFFDEERLLRRIRLPVNVVPIQKKIHAEKPFVKFDRRLTSGS